MTTNVAEVELRSWEDCAIEALNQVCLIRRSRDTTGFHEFSEYSQDDYDRAIARLAELVNERPS